MQIGVFQSGEPCDKCGGHQLLFSPRHNAHFETDLLALLEQPTRFWNVAKKRQHARLTKLIEKTCEELRHSTLHA